MPPLGDLCFIVTPSAGGEDWVLAWAARPESSDLLRLLPLTEPCLASLSPMCSTSQPPVFLGSSSAFLRGRQGQGAVISAPGGAAPCLKLILHNRDPGKSRKSSKRWGVGVGGCVVSWVLGKT